MHCDEDQVANGKYIFRGIVSFQYSHYSTFIYSPNEKTWYQIDDSFIRKMESFRSIILLMLRNDSIPVLLLYENNNGQYPDGKIDDRRKEEKNRSCTDCEVF